MNARDALAIEIHKPRFRLNVDELVAVVAIIALAVAVLFGATHPQPQAESCYHSSPQRK